MVVALLCLLGCIFAAQASLAQASLSGTVHNEDGVALAGIPVFLIDSLSATSVDATSTNSEGEYTFAVVGAGDYKVEASPTLGSPYVAERYPNVVCPTIDDQCLLFGGQDISVPGSGSVDNIDFFLDVGAVIAGRITDYMTGLPVAGVGVGAYAFEQFGPLPQQTVGQTVSLADGSYLLQGLPPSGNGGHYVWTSVDVESPYANSAFPGVACAGTSCEPQPGGQVGVVLGETTAPVDLALFPKGSCGSKPSLCLGPGGRFQVDVDWASAEGSGQSVPRGLTEDTGYFWFFDPDNVEVVLKVLDGCEINGHFWIYASGLTDVEVDLVVRDSISGTSWDRFNPLDSPFPPISDIEAFDCQ